jgi:hypothetical protein
VKWLGIALYLVGFFLFLHLVDRLAARPPPAGGGRRDR